MMLDLDGEDWGGNKECITFAKKIYAGIQVVLKFAESHLNADI